jgi:hypothetical protein
MLEVVGVIRSSIIQNEYFIGIDMKNTQEIQTKANKKVNEFLAKIFGLARQDKVILKDPDIKLKDYLARSLGILQRHIGNISVKDFCFDCQRKIPQRYNFFGLGHFDIQHAINAKELAVNELITFDKAFELLNTLPEFNSINVKVLSKKHSSHMTR